MRKNQDREGTGSPPGILLSGHQHCSPPFNVAGPLISCLTFGAHSKRRPFLCTPSRLIHFDPSRSLAPQSSPHPPDPPIPLSYSLELRSLFLQQHCSPSQ